MRERDRSARRATLDGTLYGVGHPCRWLRRHRTWHRPGPAGGARGDPRGHFGRHTRVGRDVQCHAHCPRVLHSRNVFSTSAPTGAGPVGFGCAHVYRPAVDPEHARALAAPRHSGPLLLLALVEIVLAAHRRLTRVLSHVMRQIALIRVVPGDGAYVPPTRGEPAQRGRSSARDNLIHQ
jgi:hypothetical protein